MTCRGLKFDRPLCRLDFRLVIKVAAALAVPVASAPGDGSFSSPNLGAPCSAGRGDVSLLLGSWWILIGCHPSSVSPGGAGDHLRGSCRVVGFCCCCCFFLVRDVCAVLLPRNLG